MEGKKEHLDTNVLEQSGSSMRGRGIGSVIFSNPKVQAAMKNLTLSIEETLGFPKSIASYTEVLNTSQTDKGITVTLKEVVLDDGVLLAPDDESRLFIKRVIGLPGETVEIKDGKVYINDSSTPLDDSFIPEKMTGNYGPYKVPENCYFMLGDNRNNSNDSRFWKNKFVRFDQLVGKAVVRYYPSIKWLG